MVSFRAQQCVQCWFYGQFLTTSLHWLHQTTAGGSTCGLRQNPRSPGMQCGIQRRLACIATNQSKNWDNLLQRVT